MCLVVAEFPSPVTLTASASSELDFTTCISSSYLGITKSVFPIWFFPSTSVVVLMQTSTDGGSTYDTTSGHYHYGRYYVGTNYTGAAGNNTATAGFDLSGGGGATSFSGRPGTFLFSTRCPARTLKVVYLGFVCVHLRNGDYRGQWFGCLMTRPQLSTLSDSRPQPEP